MNYTLFTQARNCCDINVCHESCMIIGHPTFLGFLVLISIILSLTYIIRYFWERNQKDD
jgi:hypothetical protein